MAPPRSKPQPDDSRSEASSTKEKPVTSTTNATNGKGRRVAGNAAGGSSLRDVVTAGSSGTAGGASTTAVAETAPGVSLRLHNDLYHSATTAFPAPMVYLRSYSATRLSIRLSFEHPGCLQEAIQSTCLVPISYRSYVPYNGTSEGTAQAEQGTVGEHCAKAFQ